MTNHKVIYHIGLPKTGTTTIQYYLKKQQGTKYDAVLKNQDDFFEIINFIRGKLSDTEIRPRQLEKTLIYSAEEIAATWLRVNQTNHSYPDWQPLNLTEVLDRLRNCHRIKFGLNTNMTLMIGIRDLSTFIPSWYAQFFHSHIPTNSNFLDLLNYIEKHKSSYDGEAIQRLVETQFHDVIVYRQETLFGEQCTLIRDLSLNGITISVNNVRLNTRRSSAGYTKRLNPIGRRASFVGILIPKPIKKLLRRLIFSKIFQNLSKSTWTMTPSEKQRLDEVCKY